jgi:hypothetical protein
MLTLCAQIFPDHPAMYITHIGQNHPLILVTNLQIVDTSIGGIRYVPTIPFVLKAPCPVSQC